jgi:hypothetical protein
LALAAFPQKKKENFLGEKQEKDERLTAAASLRYGFND